MDTSISVPMGGERGGGLCDHDTAATGRAFRIRRVAGATPLQDITSGGFSVRCFAHGRRGREWQRGGADYAARAIPAAESALGSLPSVALSSAQVIAILNPTSGVGGEFTLFY